MTALNLARFLAVLCLCACSAQRVSAQSDAELVDQLRADYAALLDARVEFAQIEAKPDLYTPEQADFAGWIQQLSAQFAASCDEFSNQAPELIPSDIPCAEFSQVYTSPANIDIRQEKSHGEQVAAGEDSFEKTLGEFDEKLLREQDRVKARRPQSSDSAAAGGEAGGGAGAGAGETEGGAAENGSDEGEQASQQSDEQGSDVSGGDDRQAQGSRGASSRSSAPPGTPDGHDDDVIARQLREAAEKETNPELKRKLWEEYRRYKSGI